jgi:pyrroline-5-carboxylate reductase
MAPASDTAQLGVIGAGRLATAVVRGWDEPVLVSARTVQSAATLAQKVGGESLDSNRALAERARVIVLAVEPQAFGVVAAEIAGAVTGKPVISLLARTPLRTLQGALPAAIVARAMPNVAAEIRRSTTCISEEREAGPEAHAAARGLFDRVGTTFAIPDDQMDVVTWLCGSGPAWNSFIVETVVDVAAEAGIDRGTAELVSAVGLRDAAESLAGRSDANSVPDEIYGLDPDVLAELRATLTAAARSALDASLSTPGASSISRA